MWLYRVEHIVQVTLFINIYYNNLSYYLYNYNMHYKNL